VTPSLGNSCGDTEQKSTDNVALLVLTVLLSISRDSTRLLSAKWLYVMRVLLMHHFQLC